MFEVSIVCKERGVMQKLLEELLGDKIDMYEERMSAEAIKLRGIALEREKELIACFKNDDRLQKAFDVYDEAQGDLIAQGETDQFIAGFKLGLLLGAEVFWEKKDK